jgi:hypothetical protein
MSAPTTVTIEVGADADYVVAVIIADDEKVHSTEHVKPGHSRTFFLSPVFSIFSVRQVQLGG